VWDVQPQQQRLSNKALKQQGGESREFKELLQ
jgi:hypothetical protein